MKKILLLLPVLLLFAVQAKAQKKLVHAAKSLSPTEEFDNVHVQKLFNHQHSSGFVIWIKEGVKAHKHAAHTETVYILKGKGSMRLGEENREIRKGDIIFIPQGTPHAVTVKGRTMQVLSIQAPEFDGTDRIWVD